MSKKDEHNYIIQDLQATLDRINDWIKNCDSKASILIAAITLFFTIFSNDTVIDMSKRILFFVITSLNIIKIIYMIIFILLVALIVFGVTCLILTLNPITSKKTNKDNVENKSSVYFFGAISGMKFREYSKNYSHVIRNPKKQIRNIQEQIYINSSIATKKYSLFKKGVYATFFGSVGVILLFIIGVVLVVSN